MKKLITKLLTRLNGIGKDKYQHFALGAVVAATTFLVPRWIGAGSWLALGLSAVAVLCAALYKERRFDPVPDARDLLATLIGGAVVWVVALWILIF